MCKETACQKRSNQRDMAYLVVGDTSYGEVPWTTVLNSEWALVQFSLQSSAHYWARYLYLSFMAIKILKFLSVVALILAQQEWGRFMWVDLPGSTLIAQGFYRIIREDVHNIYFKRVYIVWFCVSMTVF